MAKRGRPRKNPAPAPKRRGRPPKDITKNITSPVGARHASPLLKPSASSDPWAKAFALSHSVSDQYAMGETEQHLAFDLALILEKGATIVELGVTYGRTAIILCSAAQITGTKYFGIDNFKMDTTKLDVEKSLNSLELPGQIIIGDTNTVPWDKPIDYLLFDAGHDETNMKQDTARWLPLVKPGGLVLFHAYNPKVDFTDPHYPVQRYADQYTSNWPTIAYIPYLLVKQKPLA